MLHTFLGLSKVSFWTHFWGSLVGYAVPLFLLSFFGQKLFDLMTATPRERLDRRRRRLSGTGTDRVGHSASA